MLDFIASDKTFNIINIGKLSFRLLWIVLRIVINRSWLHHVVV